MSSKWNTWADYRLKRDHNAMRHLQAVLLRNATELLKRIRALQG